MSNLYPLNKIDDKIEKVKGKNDFKVLNDKNLN